MTGKDLTTLMKADEKKYMAAIAARETSERKADELKKKRLYDARNANVLGLRAQM